MNFPRATCDQKKRSSLKKNAPVYNSMNEQESLGNQRRLILRSFYATVRGEQTATVFNDKNTMSLNTEFIALDNVRQV
jgi:hypothetical protein